MLIKLSLIFCFLLCVAKMNNLCDKKCLECNEISKTCIECEQGYELNLQKKQCFEKLSLHDEIKTNSQVNLLKSELLFSVKKKFSINSKRNVHRSRVLAEIPNCLFSDPSNQVICQVCQPGFTIQNGQCKQLVKDCLEYDNSGTKCLKCKYELYLQGNYCIDVHCILSEYGTDHCMQCQEGYKVDKGNTGYCMKNTGMDNKQNITQNCNQYNANNQCISCNPNYYLTLSKSCQLVPQNCQGVDIYTSKCVSCLSNFRLTQMNTCEQISLDPNCKRYEDAKCKQCSNRHYFNSQNKCTLVSTLCKGYNIVSGKCLDCYAGYTLNVDSGECMISLLSNCKRQSSMSTLSSSKCLQCYNGFFLNSSSLCQLINPLCKTSNPVNGQCLSCYQGYTLVMGTCKSYVDDPNCKRYNQLTGKCQECVVRYFYNQQKCVAVNPLCKGYNVFNGWCTQCYMGYQVKNGLCVVNNADVIMNCKVQQNGVCVTCSDNYYFNQKRECVERNPLCKTFNSSNGYCTSCYQGYVVKGSQCVVYKEQITIENCLTPFNSTYCIKCQDGYLSSNGKCEKADKNCKTANTNGNCLTCYNGYIIVGDRCISIGQVLQGMNSSNRALISNVNNEDDVNSTVNRTSNTQTTSNSSTLNPLCSSKTLAPKNIVVQQSQPCTLNRYLAFSFTDPDAPLVIRAKVSQKQDQNAFYFSASQMHQVIFSKNSQKEYFNWKTARMTMPAEHLMNGERMSLELQLSYRSKDDKDLILSIMFKDFSNEGQISAQNKNIITSNQADTMEFTLNKLLNSNLYFHYTSFKQSDCISTQENLISMNPQPITQQILSSITKIFSKVYHPSQTLPQPIQSNKAKIQIVGGICNYYSTLNKIY